MSERASVSYESGPHTKVGEYRGRPIMAFGVYRVRLDDGFTMLQTHSGFPGTVSEAPVDLDHEPDFVQLLIERAERLRERVGETADA